MVELPHRYEYYSYDKKIKSNKKVDKPEKQLSSLKSLIQSRQKKEIVKKIFGNNEKEFEKLIDELEPIKNWTDAFKRVERELNKRNIYLHEPDAILFTNILYFRYFPDEDQF
jgi:hypothetical protein